MAEQDKAPEGLILLNQRNSKKQGDVGVGVAIGWFATQGWTVCIPLTDSQPYDLIVDGGDGLKKVQVKTTNRHTQYNTYEVGLKTSGGNRSGTGKVKKFDPKNVDLLFVLAGNGKKYLLPSHIFDGKRNSLCLGRKYQGFEIK